MLEWLGQILDSLTSVFPRILKVRNVEKLIIWNAAGQDERILVWAPLVLAACGVVRACRHSMANVDSVRSNAHAQRWDDRLGPGDDALEAG